MATTLEIEFSFTSSHGLPRPDIRMWIDANGDGQMAKNEEVQLQPDANGPSWSGSCSLPSDKTTGVGFLVAYQTTVPNHWQLTIKDGGDEVFSDGGDLKHDASGFVIGSCK